MKKRILAMFMAFIMCLGHMPAVFAAEEETVVYVTLSDQGDIAKSNGRSMALVPVTVTDADEDGSLTVNDTLELFHDEYCPGGYSTYQSDWGLSLGTLWGDSSGAFGYYLNDKSCGSLTDAVKNGDRLTAYIYKDQLYWSDAYTFFEQTTTCGEFELVLNKSGYDASWNPITLRLSAEEIGKLDFGIKGPDDETFSFSETVETDLENSSVTFNIEDNGEYIVTARSSELNIVPPVFKFFIDEAEEDSAIVYTTISIGSEIVKSGNEYVAAMPVTVTDKDGDGSLTVDDTLKVLHEECGTEYSSAVGQYGLGITTLWGDTSGSYGYYLNDNSCWSLTDTVTDGDFLTAFVYESPYWEDKYTYFKGNKTAKANEDIPLELVANIWDNTIYNYNETAITGKRDIYMIKNGKLADSGFDTDDNGKTTLSFENEGTYILTASTGEGSFLVPPIFKITISGIIEDNNKDDETSSSLWSKDDLDDIKASLAEYFLESNSNKIPGDWAVFNLALMGENHIDRLFADDEALQDYVNSTISAMDSTNLSDCARVLIALTSIGIDGSDLSQYRTFHDKNGNDVKNLVKETENLLNDNKEDYITSKIYAYIALNCAEYSADEYTLSTLKNDILSCLDDPSTDRDSLFMAITSLWNEESEKAESVFTSLVSSISEKGTIGNANTTAWAVIAARSLGIDADTIKHANGRSLLDGILTFITADKTSGLNDNSSTNDMASRDVLTALICNDKTGTFSPYDFSSVKEYDKTDWATVTSIDIVSKPEKTEYLKGEKLDLTGLKIKIILSDGTSFNIQGNDNRIKTSGFNSKTTGRKTVTISYGGIKKSFTVNVYSKHNNVFGEIWLKVFDPKSTTYYWSEDFSIEYGDTPISVLDKANIPYSSRDTEYGTYIESIYNLGEGDKGAGSGWMVSVNNIFISTSAENIGLRNGDSVKWVYTRD
ncbi:MAG: bacterial Ig-like domain-containing protein, partial [Firmicutes bacterium]|nr:bacterial Ig-like domain-containing protein [Bacillota bacterium]